jgi:uncharacterized protein (DUF1800 family)
MELFTLGEGQYSEQDIKEVARAFTGWSVDADAGEFRFRRALHDDGVKRIFGQEGRFNGDDVITLLLQQPGDVRVCGEETLAGVCVGYTVAAGRA